MQHKREICSNLDCGGTCFTCTLWCCSVCGGAEASLTKECPGRQLTIEESAEIIDGKIDFVNDGWVILPKFLPTN